MTVTATLFCFPFAGGNAYSYRPLERNIHPAIKVVPLEPPGRGRRTQETSLTGMHEMALDMLSCVRASLDRPFAFFGHSMGALSAYLVTRLLAEEHLPLPLHLFISGKGPPHGTSREAQWHTLPPGEFKAKLAELGGCAPAVLADQELFAYFAPLIREDMRAIAEYRHKSVPPFDVPITVMIGTAESTTYAEASGWKDMTTSDCSILQFEGDHFFLFDHIDSICELLNSTLLAT
ncbi:MAG: alpha/beta fold hydrolase [Pedobacter sp.]